MAIMSSDRVNMKRSTSLVNMSRYAPLIKKENRKRGSPNVIDKAPWIVYDIMACLFISIYIYIFNRDYEMKHN